MGSVAAVRRGELHQPSAARAAAAARGVGSVAGSDGCGKVPFDPSFDARVDTRKADAPAGLSMDLSFPQEGPAIPTGIATGHLKRATVRLPEGWTVSPSAADGLEGCSDAQSRMGTLLGAACPAASKIGTVEATTPLLDEKCRRGVRGVAGVG